MGVHLYCVGPADHRAAAVVGVDDAFVDPVATGPLVCWLSEHEHAPAASAAAVRAHNRVVEAVMTRFVTPVPMRFGQWFESAGEAAAKVSEQQARWLALLDRFAGHAEYGVRIGLDAGVRSARDVHPRTATTGKAYMAALAERQAEAARRRADAARLAQWLAARIGTLAAETWLDAAAPETQLAIAHLVAWDDADEYRSSFAGLRAERDDLRIVTSGPWPPYSFISRASG